MFSRSIKSPQRLMRMLTYKKSGLATPALIEGQLDVLDLAAPIADNGVGDSTIAFKEAFLRIPACIAISTTSATMVRCVPALGSVQVLSFAMDGTTPAEADYDLIVMGGDAEDQA